MLAAAATSSGARLFEHSPVTGLAPGRVGTAEGEVHCDAVVVAVDGRLDLLLPELAGTVRTVRLQMLGTAPTDEVRVPRDGQAVRLILPFTGGEIETQELLVRSAEGAGVVDAVAVRHDPPLSAVEAAALTLLPRDLLSVNLGVALPGGIAMDNDEERRRQAE